MKNLKKLSIILSVVLTFLFTFPSVQADQHLIGAHNSLLTSDAKKLKANLFEDSQINANNKVQYTLDSNDPDFQDIFNAIVSGGNITIATDNLSSDCLADLKSLPTLFGYKVTSIDLSQASYITIHIDSSNKISDEHQLIIETSYSRVNEVVTYDEGSSSVAVQCKSIDKDGVPTFFSLIGVKNIFVISLDDTVENSNISLDEVMPFILGENGDELHEEVLLNNIGGIPFEKLEANRPSYDNYTFKEYKLYRYVLDEEGNKTGFVEASEQEAKDYYSGHAEGTDFTWIRFYTSNPVVGGDITVHYVSESGNTISDDVVKTGNVGEEYSTDQKDIEGYTFKEMGKDSAAVSGEFTDQAQTVTYVYTKNPVAAADVTAKYVDTKGNKISDDVIKSGNIGEKYTTDQKDIEGYTFKEMGKDSAAVSGEFTDQAQTVTYVYTKDKVNPTPADNKPSHKEDSTKTENSSSTYATLPETGENERMTLMSIGTGLIFLMVALIASVFHFKKFKNNK